ncbi:FkbM family methyltransferase [Daejeonella sp.]|uniref:FkbM family methyltransferase n=1 Tax=Daejeonella sp. TaxID=2805397 RepID=UPI0025C5F24B|nr:FkbM family methyltransferase [Daejeonella sp.]
MFFKRSWSEEKIRKYFNELLIEQDIRSPHLYLTNDFNITEETTIADLGVAEGNFSLSVVEKSKSLYLFEADSEWIEALTETFATWKNKVTIINKMVSNINDSEHLSLDVFFEKKAALSFLKIDVDGAEKVVMEGAEKIITEQIPLQIALCTYHKQEDEGIYTSLLNKKGFQVEASKGFMIFINGGLKFLNKPFFRRGLIRASKYD